MATIDLTGYMYKKMTDELSVNSSTNLLDTNKHLQNYSVEIDKEIGAIVPLIDQINLLYRERARVTFDDVNEKNLNDKIKKQNDEIMARFVKCKSMIEKLPNYIDKKNEKDQKIVQNVMKSKISALSRVSEQFKKNKSTYNNYFNRQNEFRIQIDDPFHDEKISDPHVKYYQYQEQVYPDLEQEHRQEIEQIANDVKTLAEMFTDLNIMVENQQQGFDNIESNINNAYDYVESGLEQIEKAYEYKKGCKTTLCILFLILLVIILSVVIALIVVYKPQ